MVALLSFSLPIRPDVDRQNNELKAQSVVTKFRAQHNAFKRYIESKKLTHDEQVNGTERVIYYSGLGYKGGQMLPSKISGANLATKAGFRNTQGMTKPFDPETEKEIVKGYLPFGFDGEASNIYSKVFCFAKMPGETWNYQYACEQDGEYKFSYDKKPDCCASDEVDVYVISWQKMPDRWVQKDPSYKNEVVSQPTTDMMSVISKADGYGYNFGYVTYVKELSSQKSSGYDTMHMDKNSRIMSGGMYRFLKAQVDVEGETTGKYHEVLGYRPIFDVLLQDEDFKGNNGACLDNIGNIKNPCLIAINRVNNRAEAQNGEE